MLNLSFTIHVTFPREFNIIKHVLFKINIKHYIDVTTRTIILYLSDFQNV